MKTLVSGILFFCLMITSHFGMAQLQVTVIQNNSNCVMPNGTASATVGGTTLGYTFLWYDVTLNPLGVTGPTINSLAAGNYSVIATEVATNIQTTIHFVIMDHLIVPHVTLESHPNTSCTTVGNGTLVALFEGSHEDYSFAWYQGADPAGSLISTSVHLHDASAGSYTLQVTNLSSGCYT
jgi:hypothetical protein